MLVNQGYGPDEIRRFTLGEFICRVHAVSFIVKCKNLNERSLQLIAAPFGKPEDKEQALAAMKRELHYLENQYDNLIVDW